MYETRICGNCPVSSVELITGDGITKPERQTVIKCPFNPEFPRNPLDICSHKLKREQAGYRFDAGSVARLLDLCRMHDISMTMEYRRSNDAYLLTFTKNSKRIYIYIPTEKLEENDSPEKVIEQYVNTALSSILL